MRVNLLFGFLGSGKTTLVRRILAERAQRQPLAVIVNEFGEVGIDGAILEGRNVDVVELTSGCLCCTLKGPLLNAIEELRDTARVQRVVVEATGIAQPEDMLETLADPSFRTTVDVGPLVTVVDTAKFSRLRDNLGEFYGAQIANADVLLLNKIDLLKPEQLESVRREVRALNPDAALLFSEQCEVDLGFILDGDTSALIDQQAKSGRQHAGETAHEQVHSHGAHPHVDSVVLEADGNGERASVESFFAALPQNVWRAKGFMMIDGQPSLVQFAAGQLEITPAGSERRPRVVFIGTEIDRHKLEREFTVAARGAPAVS